MEAGEIESALKLFELSLDHKDVIPTVLYGKAIACARLGHFKDARGSLGELLAREPEHCRAKELLAYLEKGG